MASLGVPKGANNKEQANREKLRTEASLKFEQLQSSIDTTFWQSLARVKIDHLKLSDSPIDISGRFTGGAPHPKVTIPPRIYLDKESFDKENAKLPPFYFRIPGTLHNMNKIEDFKGIDKKKLLLQVCQTILKDIESGNALKNPSLLQRFYMISFADLKKHKYLYWLCFPAIMPDKFEMNEYDKPVFIQNDKLFESENAQSLLYSKFESFYNNTDGNQSCFVLNNNFEFSLLSDLKEMNDNKMLVYIDSGTLSDHPSWHLRNILLLISNKFPKLSKLKVLCLRNLAKNLVDSIILSIELKNGSLPNSNDLASIRAVGWERDASNKPKPRKIDLGQHLDPIILAKESSDLNLKLMKWRQFPDLKLDIIQSTKCLLLGAGTLGCQVARNLIGWGVRDITFVDNGRVSFSNPARQCLYTFEDCKNGGKYKAEAAVYRLKEIFPSINAKSSVLSIPMPGHPVTNNDFEKVKKEYDTLVELIKECDVLFLLLDSREARWLPTVLGIAYDKIVLNAALGFDSYVVMRHGNIAPNELEMLKKSHKDDKKNNNKQNKIENKENEDDEFLLPIKPKTRLGCYYCQDVVAPRNSIADRTLDQQCTVTRPGLSPIAGSIITELMVCIVQDEERQYAQTEENEKKEESALQMHNINRTFSVIPHQIRGSLHDYSCKNYSVTNFDQCPACSETIICQYFENGFEFVIKVLNQPQYLEDVCGLSQLQSELDACDFGFDDDDEMDIAIKEINKNNKDVDASKPSKNMDNQAVTTQPNDKQDDFVAV